MNDAMRSFLRPSTVCTLSLVSVLLFKQHFRQPLLSRGHSGQSTNIQVFNQHISSIITSGHSVTSANLSLMTWRNPLQWLWSPPGWTMLILYYTEPPNQILLSCSVFITRSPGLSHNTPNQPPQMLYITFIGFPSTGALSSKLQP